MRRNPRILIVVDWNSWIKGESENEELTNSFEPSTTLGTYYIDLLGAEIAKCGGNCTSEFQRTSAPAQQVEVPALEPPTRRRQDQSCGAVCAASCCCHQTRCKHSKLHTQWHISHHYYPPSNSSTTCAGSAASPPARPPSTGACSVPAGVAVCATSPGTTSAPAAASCPCTSV